VDSLTFCLKGKRTTLLTLSLPSVMNVSSAGYAALTINTVLKKSMPTALQTEADNCNQITHHAPE
jgi:hypothetical protein